MLKWEIRKLLGVKLSSPHQNVEGHMSCSMSLSLLTTTTAGGLG